MPQGASSSRPPFRAEHIGSLLRPQSLIDARRAFDTGELDAAGLRAAEDAAIREVVAMQEDLGLEVVTDGEFRRGTYSDSFTTSGISGISVELTEDEGFTKSQTHGHRTARRIPKVVDRVRWKGPQNAEDFKFLNSVTKATGKITLPGPAYIHYRAGRDNISRDVYPDLDDFWNDLVKAYHEEMRALREAGCTYLQFDETSLVKLGDERVRKLLAERGDDWQDLLGLYIDVLNQVAAGAPDGLTVGIHICRSQDPSWQANVGYDPIASAIFKDLDIDIYFLEYHDERTGTFEPLKEVPEGKTVVLGLVHSRGEALESVEGLKARVSEASRYIPLDRLALSPHCGFSTSVADGALLEREKAKLARVVEASRQIWGQ